MVVIGRRRDGQMAYSPRGLGWFGLQAKDSSGEKSGGSGSTKSGGSSQSGSSKAEDRAVTVAESDQAQAKALLKAIQVSGAIAKGAKADAVDLRKAAEGAKKKAADAQKDPKKSAYDKKRAQYEAAQAEKAAQDAEAKAYAAAHQAAAVQEDAKDAGVLKPKPSSGKSSSGKPSGGGLVDYSSSVNTGGGGSYSTSLKSSPSQSGGSPMSSNSITLEIAQKMFDEMAQKYAQIADAVKRMGAGLDALTGAVNSINAAADQAQKSANAAGQAADNVVGMVKTLAGNFQGALNDMDGQIKKQGTVLAGTLEAQRTAISEIANALAASTARAPGAIVPVRRAVKPASAPTSSTSAAGGESSASSKWVSAKTVAPRASAEVIEAPPQASVATPERPSAHDFMGYGGQYENYARTEYDAYTEE